MKLSVYILSLLLVPLCLLSVAQPTRIDSLKKSLPSLRDTSRIDQLAELSNEYILVENKDSACYYALLTHAEAAKQNYLHGIALSLSLQSQIAKHFDDDFIASEILGKQSLEWYKKTGNIKGLDKLYFYLMYTVFSQSKFDEAKHYAEKKYELAKQTGDAAEIIESLTVLFAIYRQSGDYEKSFVFAREAYDIATTKNNKLGISRTLYGMAQLYTLIEDYPSSLAYFQRVLQMDDEETRKDRVDTDNDIWFKMELAEVYSRLYQFDSAWHYYHRFKPVNKPVYMRVYWVSTGECYYLQKDYPHALQNFQLGLAEHQKLNDRNEVMRTLVNIGKTYLALGKNTEALEFSRKGLSIALQTKSKQFIRDGYQVLSTVYDRLGNTDSANFYFRQYSAVKDAVLTDQGKAKFAAYNYDQKIALLNKEKEIHQARLEKEVFVKKVLVAGIIVLALFGFMVIRTIILNRRHEKQQMEHKLEIQKLESKRTQAELQQQATELEMQALRAQMNPHFIFNSLNSINRFILQNNKAQASEYLTKFSKLVRMILQNSQASFITLENELESLKLYLDLEALRFDHHFEYIISVPPDLDADVMKVPPLIIQPYVENAIWHGLMHKQEKGHLNIELEQEGDYLFFIITDDGIGRKQADLLNSKKVGRHQSMGLKITADRIAMLHKLNGNESPVTINDLVNPDGSAAGTEVIVKLPAIHA
jgi:tetratricopeptide (TPR) repeat protein